jgi:hypothetical protein
LGVAPAAYVATGAVILATSGPPISVDRLAYGLVPLSIALGMVWERVPALGLPVLIVYALQLPEAAQRFVEQKWVA